MASAMYPAGPDARAEWSTGNGAGSWVLCGSWGSSPAPASPVQAAATVSEATSPARFGEGVILLGLDPAQGGMPDKVWLTFASRAEAVTFMSQVSRLLPEDITDSARDWFNTKGMYAARERAPVQGAEAQPVALRDLVKPWQFHTGEPPSDDSPLSCVFGAGMTYTEELLAKHLGVEQYERGDGSEDFDQDATKTLENILTAAKLYDAEEGRWATLAPPDAPRPDIEAARPDIEAARREERERCANIDWSDYFNDDEKKYIARTIRTLGDRP